MKDDVAINVSGVAPQFKGRSFVEKIDIARDFGLNSIEFHPLKEWERLSDLGGAELRQIKEKISGLDRVSVHAPMGETFTNPDNAESEQAIRENKAAIQAAGILGVETRSRLDAQGHAAPCR